ncbi:UVSSA-like protein [Mya arenaria]|uniref:UVSSA-like protein n=1 Tax=Mya arenaria TaxID=6604 RepID=A0ABY7FMK7_MYAAR|nr:UVSSA-like protein [Mya arenaria]
MTSINYEEPLEELMVALIGEILNWYTVLFDVLFKPIVLVAMSEELDETVCKQMKGLVELLSTSGKPILNQEVMKKFKKLCRTSDAYVNHAFELLMQQLHIKHAEVRLSVCQMVDELFHRSHVFRELIIEDLQTFIDLTTGLNKLVCLPAPKAVAMKMKELAIKTVYLWHDKYGPAYKKLALGYEFLKTCKQVEFEGVAADVALERRKQEETERKLEVARQDRLAKVTNQMSDLQEDIELCVTEVENGLELLMPTPDQFFIPVAMETSSEQEVTSSITSSSNNQKVISSESNSLENSFKLSSQTLSNAPSNEDSQKSKLCDQKSDCDGENVGEDFLQSLCKCGSKIDHIEEFSVISQGRDISKKTCKHCQDEPIKTVGNSEYEKESDNEDTADSDGFSQQHGLFNHNFSLTINVGGVSEPRVEETEDNKDIIEDVRGKYRLIKNRFLPKVKKWVETLTENKGDKVHIDQLLDLRVRLETVVKKCVELEIKAARRAVEEEDSDSEFEDVPDKDGYEEDIPEHKEQGCVIEEGESTGHVDASVGTKDKKKSLLEKAPVVAFGVDIEHWESPDKIKPAAKVRYDDASRFWVAERDPDDLETGEQGGSEEVASLTRRTFTYTGEFEPVKWKCRAPLSNGKLCERMDRVKCPFHGPVIGRDNEGQPTEAEDIDRLNRERIHREIEEASTSNGDNSEGGARGKGKGKGKGKAKKRKYPNLTDIQDTETSRSRLEAKIFNRTTLRKVNNALDAASMKKLAEKFSNQFNYIFTDQHKITSVFTDQHKITTVFTDQHKITSVLTDQHKITTVFTDQHKITSVLTDQHKITTVFTEQHKITTVFTDQHKITAVFTDQHKITTVFTDQHKITTVFTDQHKITSVLTDQHKITTVFTEQHKITTVFTDQHKITTVFIDQHKITTVFTDQHKITTVFTDQHKITTVFTDQHRSLQSSQTSTR